MQCIVVAGLSGAQSTEYFDPPKHAKFFTDRKFRYAKLGIEAIELVIRMFNETGHIAPLTGAAALREKLYTPLAEVETELWASEQRTSGLQHISIHYTERLSEPGIEPSVGSKGTGQRVGPTYNHCQRFSLTNKNDSTCMDTSSLWHRVLSTA